MNIKIKKLHPEAVIPSYAKEGDAGMDLTAITKTYDKILNQFVYGTGLAIEIPPGYVGLIYPRSSIHKVDLRLSNSVGVIDSSYRGEITAVFDIINPVGTKTYKTGERIAQIIIMPYPKIIFQEVFELTETERGSSGFGSSGK